jgi:hypothetical protein
MDSILRLPFINEAEVHDIIKSVYQSKATQITNTELKKIDAYP